MKRLVIVGLVLVGAFIMALLFWHQRNHPGDVAVRQSLPGTWVETGQDGVKKTIAIDPDGHSVMLSSSGVRAEGTTVVKDGLMICTITNSSQPMTLPFTQSVRIIRMDAHELVVPGDRNRSNL